MASCWRKVEGFHAASLPGFRRYALPGELRSTGGWWPVDKDVLKDSYIDGIKLLYKTYKIFYAEEETEEMVLEQWEDLKAEINVPTGCLNSS